MVRKRDELVAIVDREDNVLYVTQRYIADNYRLRMRSARAIVFDPDMNIWIHRRALSKPVNNGLYDVGVGETPHVSLVDGHYEHESYAHAVKRGISEELFGGKVSIDDVVVEHISKLPSIDIPSSPRNYDVFAFYYDQSCHDPITPEKEEVEEGSGRFLSVQELQELLQREETFMGIAPVIAQLALYVIKNPGLTLKRITVNQKEVYGI